MKLSVLKLGPSSSMKAIWSGQGMYNTNLAAVYYGRIIKEKLNLI